MRIPRHECNAVIGHSGWLLEAQERISSYIHRTPLLRSKFLDKWLGHEIVFKAEGLQKIGAFKARGAINALLSLQESSELPKEVAAFSLGNHSQAVAWACKQLGVKANIFLPSSVSAIKIQATRAYGAHVTLTETRQEAEALAAAKQKQGAALIHPFDNDAVIAGQGTACLEALQDGDLPNAIFAPCGGGGLLSGTYLAAQLFDPQICVFGAEPKNANDAAQSYRAGKIIRFNEPPQTIADGTRTLAVAERTFYYLKKLNGFYEIEEDEIIYWTQWLIHLLKVAVEPSSALAMAAAYKWIKEQEEKFVNFPKQRILVILSGANVDPETYHKIWDKNLLLS